MNILLLGPQGSGKGTQARLLVEKYGFYYLETGALLREAAKKDESLRKIMAEGNLVPSSKVCSLVVSFLEERKMRDNILFDGFPRNTEQCGIFKDWFKKQRMRFDLVIILNISEEEAVKRLSARRIDPATGKIYNLVSDRPPAEVDAKSLVQREDDRPGAIRKRLAIYRSQTEPLIAKLRGNYKILEVDGERPIDVIAKDISEEINKLKNG